MSRRTTEERTALAQAVEPTIGDLVDTYNAVTTRLREAVGMPVWDDLDDMREEVWMGDDHMLYWCWDEEWQYGVDTVDARIEKGGLVFFWTYNNGRSAWLVFDKAKYEHHEVL